MGTDPPPIPRVARSLKRNGFLVKLAKVLIMLCLSVKYLESMEKAARSGAAFFFDLYFYFNGSGLEICQFTGCF